MEASPGVRVRRVYRLRYNGNDESSPKGDDVLAFEFADETRDVKDTVIVAEVKVRTAFRSDAVEEAHEALRRGAARARGPAGRPVLVVDEPVSGVLHQHVLAEGVRVDVGDVLEVEVLRDDAAEPPRPV